MKFIPNSIEKDSMLKEIGLKDIDDLFVDISKDIRVKNLDLADGLSQQDVEKKLRNISKNNKSYIENLSFLGGGIKPHYIPAVVKSICSRSEFFTSYTPYQSEASQGFLQAMFEYQSMIAELLKMDIANCSLYDGFTALGEAALMCTRINRKNTFLIPDSISWDKKSVLKNYVKGANIEIKEILYDKYSGKIDIHDLENNINSDTAGVYLENPNFFGVLEDDIEKISKIVGGSDALFVVGVDPLSLGIVNSPGDYGADIVIGEGRSLGGSISFGGSSLGLFACKKDFLRQMPGRIIGLTSDVDAKQSFCMALQTREQHIRRGRATSNICTNEGLCALTAVTYLSWLGGEGLENLSRINFEKGQILAEVVESVSGFNKMFSGVHFNELLVECPDNPNVINKKLLKRGIQGGLPVDSYHPDLKDCMLFGVTELHSDEDIRKLGIMLKEVAHV